MNTKTVLRTLIVLEWVLVVGGIAISPYLERMLPAGLQDWLASDEAEGSLIVLLFIPALLGAMIGSVGMFLLKRWGAWLYLVCTLIVAIPYGEPLVEDSISATISELSTLIAGLIIGIGLFSGVISRSNDQNAEKRA